MPSPSLATEAFGIGRPAPLLAVPLMAGYAARNADSGLVVLPVDVRDDVLGSVGPDFMVPQRPQQRSPVVVR